MALALPLPDQRIAPPKPLLRGRLHQVGAVGSVPAGLHLLGSAATTTGRLAGLVYALSWTAMFSTSAAYHRLARTARARFWLRRADHAMIFVSIAGAYTPLCLLALPPQWGRPLLALVWLGALAGAATKLLRLDNGHPAGSWLYGTLGWLLGVALPVLVPAIGLGGLATLLGVGIVYSCGGAALHYHRPDPLPLVFGYHEVWHACTLVAGLGHFCLMLDLVSRAGA